MKQDCREIQRILAELGPPAFASNDDAQQHLAECNDCFALLEALAQLDEAVAALPTIDAPDAVVAALLARPELAATTDDQPLQRPPGRFTRRLTRHLTGSLTWPGRRAMALAATVVMAIALTLIIGIQLTQQARPAPEPAYETEQAKADAADARLDQDDGESDLLRQKDVAEPGRQLSKQERQNLRALGYVEGGGPAEATEKKEFLDEITVVGESSVVVESHTTSSVRVVPPSPPIDALEFAFPQPSTFFDERQNTGGFDQQLLEFEEVGEDRQQPAVPRPIGAREDRLEEQIVPGLQASLDSSEDDRERRISRRSEFSGKPEPSSQTTAAAAIDAAQRFLAERQQVADLTFQEPAGYWANTYVPGDPQLQQLSARLRQVGLSSLAAYTDESPRLHTGVRQTPFAFDPPERAALALYLQADQRQIEGESRLLLQVGLQAAERQGGRRPAMNIALVIDAGSEVPAPAAAALRALITAIAAARQPGDSYHLFVTGYGGGLAVGPDNFRHGPLTVALQSLLQEPDTALPRAGLAEVMVDAIETVHRADDPGAPLGASAVVLVAARPLGPELASLARLAHRGAIAGVTVSTIGVGEEADAGDLDHLALAGQGQRRFLATAAEAEALVERQLTAVARAVARAVRLSIRLAPGVRLVDVVSSRRLDAAGAERVREAEQALDLRLARNLGIAADRGDDEPGIQIVLPGFYAGDAHAVLLDVVAAGPGPIAEVTARYKDLVEPGNRVARAELSLARGSASRGPLELMVLKNLLAHRLEASLKRAGDHLGAGQTVAAITELETSRQLFAGLGSEVASWAKDPVVLRDVALLDEYLTLLARGAGGEPEPRMLLADSLRYAGQLKILPPPLAAALPER